MSNTNTVSEKLLSDRRVGEEIQRHLWFESEKAGYDIGFDRAKEDWLKKFSRAWMEYHMPDELARERNTPNAIANRKKASTAKRRRAKSYFK